MLQCVRQLHGASGPLLIVVPLDACTGRESSRVDDPDTIVFYGNKEARSIILKNEFVQRPKGSASSSAGGNKRGKTSGGSSGSSGAGAARPCPSSTSA